RGEQLRRVQEEQGVHAGTRRAHRGADQRGRRSGGSGDGGFGDDLARSGRQYGLDAAGWQRFEIPGSAGARHRARTRVHGSVRPGGPLRGAPTIANGALYLISQDNQIYALNEADGSTNWSQPASVEIAGLFGSASPAVGQGTVVAGFSSGELNAYRYENGRQVWSDTLQRTSIRTSVSSLSDVDADPVIDSGQVFAVGQGGR